MCVDGRVNRVVSSADDCFLMVGLHIHFYKEQRIMYIDQLYSFIVWSLYFVFCS